MNMNVIVQFIEICYAHVFLFQDYCTVPVWRTSLNYNTAVHFFLIFKANQKGLFVENNVSGKAQFCVQEGLKKTTGKKYIGTCKISNAVQHCYYKSMLVWMKCYNNCVLTCFISNYLV